MEGLIVSKLEEGQQWGKNPSSTDKVEWGRTPVGETDPRTPMGPADRAPFGSAGGGGRTKSGSRRSTRAVYPASGLSGEIAPLLLLVRLSCVLAPERERSVFLSYE